MAGKEFIFDPREVLPSGHGYTCERRGKRGTIQICWRDSSGPQGKSTGTSDLEEARKIFDEFLIVAANPKSLSDITLEEAMKRHWNSHAKNLESSDAFSDAQTMVDSYVEYRKRTDLEFSQLTVKGFDAAEQKLFITWARKEEKVRKLTNGQEEKIPGTVRYSDATILRRMNCIFAAINDAAENNVVLKTAIPTRISGRKWKPVTRNRKTVLTDEQMAALFNAAADHADPRKTEREQVSESWWRFMIQMTGTTARPSAAAEVESPQVDLQSGTMNLLAEGDTPFATKRRAIIKMCPTLQWHVEQWEAGPYIKHRGEKMLSLRFFTTLAEKAGLPWVTSYMVRHTVCMVMVRANVDPVQRKTMMGHVPDEGAANEYIHMRPDYCHEAVAALEAYFQRLAPLVKRQLVHITRWDDQPTPESLTEHFLGTVYQLTARQLRDNSQAVGSRNQAVSHSLTSLSGTAEP
jgi:integrase